MPILWIALGVAVGAPLGAVAAYLAARRTWRNARRLSARAKGYDHLSELGRLAGGLAHEIKNPLSTINLNLRLLNEDLPDRDDEHHRRWRRRLEAVQKEAGRLKTILDDFLRYAGRLELTRVRVDLRQVVSELVDFFAPQADAGGVVLRSSFGEVPVPCRVDEKLIKQALLNLMINAVQAMDAGGELLLKVGVQGERGFVEVIDTGPGIPPEEAGKVFQVYYSSKAQGTGLGLPTTRRILQEHGGSIRMDTEPGKGTRFIIALPLDTQPQPAETAPDAAGEPVPEEKRDAPSPV